MAFRPRRRPSSTASGSAATTTCAATFGKTVADPKATTYKPVIALFSMTALMALAASYAVYGTPSPVRAAEWFIAFSMAVLALLKLQNVESFATMFLNYDLLAKRWVPYSYIYPFAEGLAVC
jgi:hypothetical protein